MPMMFCFALQVNEDGWFYIDFLFTDFDLTDSEEVRFEWTEFVAYKMVWSCSFSTSLSAF